MEVGRFLGLQFVKLLLFLYVIDDLFVQYLIGDEQLIVDVYYFPYGLNAEVRNYTFPQMLYFLLSVDIVG